MQQIFEVSEWDYMNRLRKWLLQKGTLLTDSKRTRFSRSSVSKYNKNIPSMEKIQKIADFLHVSIADITGEEKEGGEKYYLNEETAEMASKTI